MSDWPKVLSDDAALNPMTRTCAVCQRPVGAEHGQDCKTIGRKVTIRYVFDVEVVVPFQMTNEDVKAMRLSPEWCARWAMREIARASAKTGCPCAIFDVLDVEDVSRDPIQAPGNQTPSEPLRDHYRNHHAPEGAELN